MGLLRLILAISVVLEHLDGIFGFKFTGGLVAVEVFFIISGFYMTMILDKKYIGKGSYMLFLSNRLLRLYPMFWVVLLLTIFASIISFILIDNWFILSPYIKFFDKISVKIFIFQIITNITLFGQDIVMFLGFNPESGEMYFTHDFTTSSPMFHTFLFVPQAWSLGIEVMFYLIAPFIVKRNNFIIILIIIFSMLIRIFTYVVLNYTNDPWTYRFFPSELALFLFGTISYRLYNIYKIHQTKIFGSKLTNIIVGLLFLLIIFYQFIPNTEYYIHVVNWLFYGFCCLSIPFVFDISKSSRLDSRIGELSYPVYISHILIIRLLSLIGWQEYKGQLVLVLTLLTSYILIKFISDPIEKIRQARIKMGVGKARV